MDWNSVLCEHPAVRLRQVIRPAAARGLGYWEEMEQLTKWKGTLAEAKGTPAEAKVRCFAAPVCQRYLMKRHTDWKD